MSEHSSELELDRGAESARARSHFSTCERCRQYVERLAQHEKRPPPWVKELAPSRLPLRNWWLGASFALAAAAGAAVVVLAFVRLDPAVSYTTIKSDPSVEVHVKRGDDVFIWDGVERVMPGDRLRLEITGGDHRRVQVLTAGDVSLFDAPLPAVGSGMRTLNGTAGQGGWNPMWNANLAADTAALMTTLNCADPTWTDTPGPNDSLPITCISWFEAMAFCVWDGGTCRRRPNGTTPPRGEASSARIRGRAHRMR